MVLIPFLLGRGALSLLYRKRPIQGTLLADSVLTGYLILIGLAEAAHLTAVALGRPFSDCVKLFALLLGVSVLAAAALFLWDKRRRRRLQTSSFPSGGWSGVSIKEQVLFIVFAVLVLLQILQITMQGDVYLGGDMTVETVNSFLTTGDIYKVNPLTGAPYTLGIPMRLQILCLPSLYGCLCTFLGLSAEQVVWGMVPIATLFYSYLAYVILARVLFPNRRDLRGFFLILVALLFLFGDYGYGMDGLGVMHSGFRGVTIRAAVLLPYTVGAVLRGRWKLVVLCVLAEACLVWTFYGAGACLLTAAGLLAVKLLLGCLRRAADGGKGAAV